MVAKGVFSIKRFPIFALVASVAVGLLWLGPMLAHPGLEIIDGRMEISLAQTTVSSVSDLFANIRQEPSLRPFVILMFLSFVHLKGKIALYYAMMAVAGAWGAYKYFFEFSKSRPVSCLLSVCYCCSLPLAVFYSSKYGIFSHLYAVIPLFGYLLHRLFTDEKRFYGYAGALFFLSLLIGPYNLSVYVIVLFFGVWCGALLAMRSEAPLRITRRTFAYVAVFLLLPLYHVGSQVVSLGNASPSSMAAIQSETYKMTNAQSSYANSFFLKGIWDFGVIWPVNQKAYQFQDLYGNVVLNALYALSIVALAALLITNSARMDRRILRALGFTLAILFPLIVGANQGPFAGPYVWLYDHFAPFQIFRQGYKWMPILVLVACMLYAMAYPVVRTRRGKAWLTASMLVFSVYNLVPFALGQETKSQTMFEVPKDYYEIRNRIPKNAAVLLLPEQYQSSYSWGGPGGPVEIVFSTNLVFAKPQPKDSPENARYFGIVDNILNERFETVR